MRRPSSMKKIKIIANPVSGKGHGLKAVPEIKDRLSELEIDFDLVMTEHTGHAIALTQQAVSEGFDSVIAAGGDGTANEVMNGLMLSKQFSGKTAAFGVLCVGRGNDFAFGANIPYELGAGCRCLKQNHKQWIDIGRVLVDSDPAQRFFGNGIGIGFDAVVGFEAAKFKRISGFMGYAVAALKTIFLYDKAPVLCLDIDGKKEDKPCLMVSIMNGRRMGGGFYMAPDGDMTDGKLSLCIAGNANRRTIVAVLPKFFKGAQGEHPIIQMLLAQRITVTGLDAPLPAHADGETLCEKGQKLTVEILPKQLEVICEPKKK
jgi:diacylglycerol kinase (ATP)